MKIERVKKEDRVTIPPKYRNIVGLIQRISELPSVRVNIKLLDELEKIKKLN
jgi:hypothetical protein